MEDYNLNFVLFHGTTRTIARNILDTKEFTINPRSDHWLGNGIYFFVNDLEKARWWAHSTRRNNNEKKIGILKYDNFEIKASRLLDLDSEHGRNILNIFLKELSEAGIHIFSSQEKSVKENRSDLIQIFVEQKSMIASKQTFTTENPNWIKELNKYEIYNNQVQLCIYENEDINFDKIDII
ncbi:hypothetical protein ACN2A0_02305 [Aerococcus viridans]